MPYGTHNVLCFVCGKNYTCGDCITHECPDCERKRESGEKTTPPAITDTQRLDWLMEKAHWKSIGWGPLTYTFTTPRVPGHPSIDIRAAIDAAMREPNPKPSGA